MERLKSMKETLMSCAQGQMANLGQVDAQELGEVVDMIKDLDEAMYYCSIVKAMEESEKEKKYTGHQASNYYYTMPYEDMGYQSGRMYYSSGSRSSGGNNARGGGGRGFHEGYPMMYEYPQEIRDFREGKSPMSRRGYMESKEKHQAKNVQMQELEKYLNELAQDITEMIEEAGPEEKNMLQQKLSTLASKMK